MKITKETTYAGISLNPTSKAHKGYYIKHLDAIYSILSSAKASISNPIVAHILMDLPKKSSLTELSRKLDRWNIKESEYAKQSLQPVNYFAVNEIRPRGKRLHMHVMVVFNSLPDNGFALKTLSRNLASLSDSSICKLQRRKYDLIPRTIDPNTGEFKLLGVTSYHRLLTEFEDAFDRFSYFAKVLTKPSVQKRGTNFSHSRLNGTQEQQEAKNEIDTRATDLPKQTAGIPLCHSFKDVTGKAQKSGMLSNSTCSYVRPYFRSGRYPDVLSGPKGSCHFAKGYRHSQIIHKALTPIPSASRYSASALAIQSSCLTPCAQ